MPSVLDRAPATVPLTAPHEEAERSGVPEGDAVTAGSVAGARAAAGGE
ncbi:hypothetical protein GCM10010358_44980 [Streptomyces minutiscleroticus]|uniref:Uncharacterized protein n=1 Tax=Streptomyces minutiscleroticus TaxID=68238 RepID=A0A918NPM7_9ACTN|nr:hypothetical protein GCM10010358_44980 [Streptomyces minutiscleroticus]